MTFPRRRFFAFGHGRCRAAGHVAHRRGADLSLTHGHDDRSARAYARSEIAACFAGGSYWDGAQNYPFDH